MVTGGKIVHELCKGIRFNGGMFHIIVIDPGHFNKCLCKVTKESVFILSNLLFYTL